MVRFLIIGIVIAVAFTLYSLVDAAMTDHTRARGVSKPVWIVIIVLLPVIGALLWMFLGKGDAATVAAHQAVAPDDDPHFARPRMSDAEIDAHMRDLEARLKELDDEVFPGEAPDTTRTPRPATGGGTPGSSHGSPNGDSDGLGASSGAGPDQSPDQNPETGEPSNGSGANTDADTNEDPDASTEGPATSENQEKER